MPDDCLEANTSETTKTQQRIAEYSQSVIPHSTAQWQKITDTKYTPCGETTGHITAGIYRCYYNSSGQIIFEKQPALLTDTLVRCADTVSTQVLASIQDFWTREKYFKKYGFLFKRGILLYGPPGSGKTVTISFLVRDVVENQKGIVIYCTNPYPVIQGIVEMRKIEPTRPIICVLEDLEEIVHEWGESNLLSLLDGEQNTTNIVFVATTNYIEDLSERLQDRPSRFDEKIFVDMPDAAARRNYILAKNPDVSDIESWVSDTAGLSIAHIKELILSVCCLGQDYKESLERLRNMKHSKKKRGNTIGITPPASKPGTCSTGGTTAFKIPQHSVTIKNESIIDDDQKK